MRNFFTFISILISSFLLAQTGGIRPSVIDKRADQTVSCYKSPSLDAVEISCYISGTNDTFRTITDSTGELVIKNMPAGVYTVIAKQSGYISSEYKGVIVSEMKYTYMCFEMVSIVTSDAKPKKRVMCGKIVGDFSQEIS